MTLTLNKIVEIVQPKQVIGKVEKDIKIDSVSTDTRTINKGELFVALTGKNFVGADFINGAVAQGAAVIISQHAQDAGVPVLVVEDALIAFSQLAKAVRDKTEIDFFAITGSYGKTTTKEMLSYILNKTKKCFCNTGTENNIIGVSRTILSLEDSVDCAVLELGTNHFGEISDLSKIVQPNYVVITGLASVHTEFLEDIDGVFKEKSSVFEVCPDAQGILNGDDRRLKSLTLNKQPLYFGKAKSNDVYFEILDNEENSTTILINGEYKLKLDTVGDYNAYNAVGAIAAASAVGVLIEDAVANLSSFVFPDMRMQITESNGITFVNDAYNANPKAMESSLSSFIEMSAERKIVVLADMLELGEESEEEHKKVLLKFKETNIEKVLLLGPYFSKAVKTINDSRMLSFKNKEELEESLYNIVQKGDAIFLKGSRAFELETLIRE